jgi:hypothetical protein
MLGSGVTFPRVSVARNLIEVQEKMIAAAWFVAALASLFGIAFALERVYAKRQERLGRLICKYNDNEVATRVFRREIWQGQTEMQLLDSRGEPAKKNRMLATASHEDWIYSPPGFWLDGLQVTLVNGLVAGWGSRTSRPIEGKALEVL